MTWNELNDADWQLIEPLLPKEKGRRARPSHDNRTYFCAMLHVLRTGSAWRDVPAEFGKWNSIYVRFLRWERAGIWEEVLPILVERGLTDNWPLPKQFHFFAKPASSKSRRDGGEARNRLLALAAALRRMNELKDARVGGWNSKTSRADPAGPSKSLPGGGPAFGSGAIPDTPQPRPKPLR